MKFKNIIFLFFVLSSISFVQSCAKLDVEYLNKPDTGDALNDSETVYNIAKSSILNWYMINTSSISPRLALWVSADQGTCSWLNRGMYDMSQEPRIEFNNSPDYAKASTFERYWNDMYSNLSQVNDVLKVVESGMEIGKDGQDTEMIRAVSYFIQGLSLGYLGLVYDKAFVVTNEEADVAEAKPYAEVVKAGIASLEKAIAICDANNFTLPADWINGDEYTSEELGRLAHSYIARFILQTPRNVAENNQTDWAAILAHAEKGIQKNLQPTMDGATWINYFYKYSVRPGWAKIDLRIIHLMDNSYPARFPDTGISPDPVASSDDARLESDFNYVTSINFIPDRGYYHYSNYEYSRYEYYYAGVTTGEVVDFYTSENDLMKAEALVHLGRSAEALAILNAGTRSTRGHLPALVTTSDDEILDAIFYERDIELIMTGFGIAFFDMRRRDMMQIGSPLHLPIPGASLLLIGEEYYTFGGVENADGINTSNGGWF